MRLTSAIVKRVLAVRSALIAIRNGEPMTTDTAIEMYDTAVRLEQYASALRDVAQVLLNNASEHVIGNTAETNRACATILDYEV